jgi:hypothetical protein
MAKRAGATVVEVKGSHAVYVSQPEAVADLIRKAAKSVTARWLYQSADWREAMRAAEGLSSSIALR